MEELADPVSDEEGLSLSLSKEHARAKTEIERKHTPSGYNIGINIGESAGQTIPHLHLHLIPRYTGDVPDPRGGVRHVISELANYLSIQEQRPPYSAMDNVTTIASPIYGTSDTPLLSVLVEDLAQAHRLDLAVAFILESGLVLLAPHIQDLLDRGGHVRILTGDYMDVSEP